MSDARKAELVRAEQGSNTNIEIAEYFKTLMSQAGDTVGVSNADQDIACLTRYRDLDVVLAAKETSDAEESNDSKTEDVQ